MKKFEVYIDYDDEADLLWIGRRCECGGADCIHGKGEIQEERENMFLTVNEEKNGRIYISSIALKDASNHPLWSELFRGMLGVVSKRGVAFRIGAAEPLA